MYRSSIPSHGVGLVQEGCAIIKMEVQSSEDAYVVWFGGIHVTTFVPVISHIISDKSSTTLKLPSFTFYPLHAVLPNFFDMARRRLITEGKKVVGYIPCSFYRKYILCEDEESRPDYGLAISSRQERIELLPRCLIFLTAVRIDSALQAFLAETKDGKSLRIHTEIGSYCADDPETKDMLEAPHENRSMRDFHR